MPVKTGAYHKLEFVRNWSDDYCLGFMEIWTIKNSSEKGALEAVKAALTEWVATTEDGRDAYGDYEALDFGDLLNAEPWVDASFNKIAKKHGIKKLRAESVGSSEGGYCWDERLVDDDEVKEHEDPRGEQ